MELKRHFEKLINPLLIIFVAATLRLIPHPPNFAPIAAMALFGGSYLDRSYALLIPIIALFLSDLIIGFYSPLVMISVYSSFILAGLIGLWLKKRKSPRTVVLAATASSVLFFLITNFAVWLGGWYPRSLAGLMESYTLALPFFRNTILGDLFYTGVFFSGYELVLRFIKKPALASQGESLRS
ncbi:MAG: hypothetical protein A2126_03860 [Candidatus Woykebacteria bacterium GWB1_45_5]|uniref:Rod shape-determining protein MreD n=2 Tax=Candidatus Woykeibacteriota TaxID=1817899 RepID=A0A1G1W531_9BACT|nr:MAG: hypothetical protein A2113_02345 [Candidatus Woykebacteria bacterium GWA1_44_8]OGY23627.1 MAG: hypothetical protein A2126_03860 [Candidatus Woykebacteria bacterium GWB1_45_5]